MKRIASAFALLLFLSAPLALSGCSADSLAGPDQAAFDTGSNGGQGGSGGHTGPDRDILD